MDIAVLAHVLSSLATFVVAAEILYQGREARRARDDEDELTAHPTALAVTVRCGGTCERVATVDDRPHLSG
jgi:hypothetical protein